MSDAGRPSTFTWERAEQVVARVRAGASLGSAADSIGVSRATVWRWRQTYEAFDADIRKADAEAEYERLGVLNAACDPDSGVLAANTRWFLERRWPHKWALNEIRVSEIAKENAEAEGASQSAGVSPEQEALLIRYLRMRKDPEEFARFEAWCEAEKQKGETPE